MTEHLSEQPLKMQRETMKKVTGFLKDQIEPHAAWEEKVLYPAADQRAGSQSHLFTATMRNDHKIVSRRIRELESSTTQRSPDARDFTRKTDRLLGLLTAHFENEEEILLPVLDRTMSQEEFDRDIMKRTGH
jgi:iron-sulfur cluster repair protein YtfE (RIC family)